MKRTKEEFKNELKKSTSLNAQDLLILRDALEVVIKRKLSVIVGLGNCEFRKSLNSQVEKIKETLKHVEEEING